MVWLTGSNGSRVSGLNRRPLLDKSHNTWGLLSLGVCRPDTDGSAHELGEGRAQAPASSQAGSREPWSSQWRSGRRLPLEGDLDVLFGRGFGDEEDFVPGLEGEGPSGHPGFAVPNDGGDDRAGRERDLGECLADGC